MQTSFGMKFRYISPDAACVLCDPFRVHLLYKSARMKLLMLKTIGGCVDVIGGHKRADLM
jgi:hypothetical protein